MSGPEEALAAAKTIQAPNAINPHEIKYETAVFIWKERRKQWEASPMVAAKWRHFASRLNTGATQTE
jgi:hypothetical protein